MIYEGEVICPVCGGNLKLYDHVMRIIREKKGEKDHIYHQSLTRAKTAYKSNKKKIDAGYTKASEMFDKKTNGGRVRNKKAEQAFDKAADKWASDRKSAKADYKKTKTSIKRTAKAQKKEFKADVKNYKKNANILDLSVNKDGSVNVTSRADTMKKSIAAKKGESYANKVVKQYQKQERRETVAMLTSAAVTTAGYAYLMNKYYS